MSDARRPPNSHPALAGIDEREIAALREQALDYVRNSFRGAVSPADVEDAVQGAWAALLEQRGEAQIRDLRAFVTEVAWRGARNLARKQRPVPLDPEESALVAEEDHPSAPIERLDTKARMARLAEALEQLDAGEREALRLWFVEDAAPAEACRRLGIRRSAYFKRLQTARERIEAAMELDSPAYARRQRRLLSDYVAGIAVGRARARAERLIASDPQAAVLARELRRAHEAAALILPTLGLAVGADPGTAGRLAGVLDKAYDAVLGLLGRNPHAADIAASSTFASGGARGAGVAGAGLVAKAVGGMGVGNVVLGCLGGGAVATVACVAAGVISLPGPAHQPRPEPDRSVEHPSHAPERPARRLPLAELDPPHETVNRPTRRQPAPERSKPPEAQAPAPVPAPTPPSAEPAPTQTLEPSTPPEVQEFGVAAAATPVTGAPPDTNDANGASAGTVRQEFGP